MAKDIQDSLNQTSGSTILALKSVLFGGERGEKEEKNNVGEEETEEAVGLNSVFTSKAERKKVGMVQKVKKKTGKQARNNPGKQLVWFK